MPSRIPSSIPWRLRLELSVTEQSPLVPAKIAVAVDAGILGYEMYRNGQQFLAGEGLVLKGVENTIQDISRLGRSA